MADHDQADLTSLTVELLSAYFVNNTVPSESLSGLIQSTHLALAGIDAPASAEPDAPTYTPAISLKKSLASRDHIISMIDGKPYKTLKRHLKANGLSPAEYRERYKLPASYPLVSPSFSEERRAVAAKHGLGGSRKRSANAAPAPENGTAAPADDAAASSAPSDSGFQAPAKPARKDRSTAAKPEAKPAAGRVSAKTQKPDASAPKVDVAEATPNPRRKLKIKAGASTNSSDTQGSSTDAAKSGRTKAAPAGDNSISDSPKPAKRAYKKRAPKTAQA